jgi:hypothetical protein
MPHYGAAAASERNSNDNYLHYNINRFRVEYARHLGGIRGFE